MRARGRLIVLNAVLLGVLAVVTLAPPGRSLAQPTGVPQRARGEYTMVAGKTNAGSVESIYIIDAANQELVALKWDQSRQHLAGLGYRSLDADSKALPGR